MEHTADTMAMVTYSTVLSRETGFIAFMIPSLNAIKVIAANIMNANISAPNIDFSGFYEKS